MTLAEALEKIRQGCTELDLTGNDIGAEGAKELAAALKANATLTKLDLDRNKIGDEGAKELAAALKNNATLTTLVLNLNQIGAEGAKELAAALKANATLTTLTLWSNKIGDEGAKELAAALKANASLTTLDVQWNKIGDEGAKELAAALKDNATLTALYLLGNEIGDQAALDAIQSILDANKARPPASAAEKAVAKAAVEKAAAEKATAEKFAAEAAVAEKAAAEKAAAEQMAADKKAAAEEVIAQKAAKKAAAAAAAAAAKAEVEKAAAEKAAAEAKAAVVSTFSAPAHIAGMAATAIAPALLAFGYTVTAAEDESMQRAKLVELVGDAAAADWPSTLQAAVLQAVTDFLAQHLKLETAADTATKRLQECNASASDAADPAAHQSMWQRLLQQYCPPAPSSDDLKARRRGAKILAIGPGFGFQVNKAQIDIVERAFGAENVYQLYDPSIVPSPEDDGFQMSTYLPKLQQEIASFKPDVILCASKGGAYMAALWKAGCTTPSLMINAHWQVTSLPKGVKVVLAHGARDGTPPTNEKFRIPRGYNSAGEPGFSVSTREFRYTDPDTGVEEIEEKYAFAKCGRTLEALVRTGTEGLCYLYHTPDEQSGRAATDRPGDRHVPASLLQYDTLPRLIDSLLTPAPPFDFVASSTSPFLSTERHEAELALGMDPSTLRTRWWASPGKRGKEESKLFPVDEGSAEFGHVAAIFYAEPSVERFYEMRATTRLTITRIERVENGVQQESFDGARGGVKADIESLGLTFTSGVHSRWLWHGAASKDVLLSVVNNRVAGFAPMLSKRALWGKGVYFARDAAYSVPFANGCRDEHGCKMVMLCQVEVGVPCVGEPHMEHMPSIHPKRGEAYHSFVDSAANPEMYVIEHSSQASPAYVVHFKG